MTQTFIQEVFETQREFTDKVFSERFGITISTLSSEDRLKWLKEFILSGAKEFMEMLDELPWKQHTDMNTDGNNFLEEGIDTFKFLINCFVIAGYSAEQFENKYNEKSFIVNFRYEQQKKMKLITSETDVAFFDIDGIVNNYPKEFINFVNEQTGKCFETINHIKKEDYDLYKKLKHKYRSTGFEATLSILRSNIVKCIDYLKEKGYVIVLLTARPYKKYNRLFFDTVQWLQNNGVKYDLIFFEREKTKFTLENFTNCKRKFFVDDDIENINRLANYIDKPILFENLLLHDKDDYHNINKNVTIVTDETIYEHLTN